MKIHSEFAQYIVLLAVVLTKNIFVSKTKTSKKRIIRIIKRKYPAYQIVSLRMQYADWSSTIKEAKDGHRATSAKAVIRNDEEQRTLHFSSSFRIWRTIHDAPDSGKNVPDGVYYMAEHYGAVGKKIDIDEYIKDLWIIPDKNGKSYHKSDGENWYYSIHYITNLYRTENGSVYMLNPETFEWELTEKTYSEIDYYGNYTRISKTEAEQIIRKHRHTAAAT